MRKTNEATIEVIEERENTNWLVRILTLPSRAIDHLFDRVHRFVHVWRVAHCFNTDMASASVLLHVYYGRKVWIEEEEGTTVESCLVHPPLDPAFIQETAYTLPPLEWEAERDIIVDRAMDMLIDFTCSLYESLDEDCLLIKPEGAFARSTKAPWTKLGLDAAGDRVPGSIKRIMKGVIEKTSPPLFFYNEKTTAWNMDIGNYPSFDDAKASITRACELGQSD